MDDWIADVCAALGLQPGTVDLAGVLDLARDAAHGVARPAAPVTTYLVGVAVGQGMSFAAAVDAVGALVAARGASAPDA